MKILWVVVFVTYITASTIEYESLTSFYWSLNGPNWKNNTNWLDDEVQYCYWFGINCNGTEHVIELFLPNNNLTGTLPSNLSQLLWLQNLSLGSNAITGGLSAIEGLVSIMNFDFSHNLISDTLPSFDRLCELQMFDFYSNRLYGTIPDSIGNSTNLWYLNLGNNLITGTLPDSMKNVKLVNLFLQNNIGLGGNIQYFFQEMRSFHTLIVSRCNFTGPGPEFHPESNMWKIDLTSNNFSGTVPSSWSDLKLLDQVSISENCFEGSLGGLFRLPRLRHLLADNNCFSGTLPYDNNPDLSFVSLKGNNFTGTIPDVSANTVSSITVYDVRGNPGLKNQGKEAQKFDNSVNVYHGNGTMVLGKLLPKDSYLCHVINYYQTLIFADPRFTEYEDCYCIFSNAKPPLC